MGECGIIDLDFIIPMQPETILRFFLFLHKLFRRAIEVIVSKTHPYKILLFFAMTYLPKQLQQYLPEWQRSETLQKGKSRLSLFDWYFISRQVFSIR